MSQTDKLVPNNPPTPEIAVLMDPGQWSDCLSICGVERINAIHQAVIHETFTVVNCIGSTIQSLIGKNRILQPTILTELPREPFVAIICRTEAQKVYSAFAAVPRI